MARLEELNHIPESELAEVVADFESEGARVEKIREADGKWTVKAYFDE